MLYSSLLKRFLGIEDFTPAGGLVFAAGCRFYMNLSNMMWMGMTPKAMAKNAAISDALLAEVLANIDPKQYRAAKRPPWVRLRLLFSFPKAVWMMRGFFWNRFGLPRTGPRPARVPAKGRRLRGGDDREPRLRTSTRRVRTDVHPNHTIAGNVQRDDARRWSPGWSRPTS